MKTVEERIESIVNEFSTQDEFLVLNRQILKGELEALVLCAKLEQLKETK